MQKSFMFHFTGYSMYPFLKPGDRLIVRRLEDALIEVGDIVVIRKHENLVAHRLVGLSPDGKGVLKGDSLLKPDTDIISLSSLTGRVEAIVRNNRLINISVGIRSKLKKVYARLSLYNLTYGSIKLRIRLKLKKNIPTNHSISSENEWMAIVSMLHNITPKGLEGLNWGIFKTLANKEGVSGVLYYYIKTRHIQTPILLSLEKLYQSIATRNLIYLKRLEEIENELTDEKIQVVALKGASLLNNIYQGIGMRPMGDLDLMVHSRDKMRFENLLDRLAYKKDISIPHLFKKEGVTIDLHIHALNTDRISNRKNLLPTGMGPIRKNSIPLDQGFYWLRRPDNVDNVLLLSQHLMKHSFSSLIWIKDIYEILMGYDASEWIRLSERVERFRQQRCLSYALYLTKKLFHLGPPREMLRQWKSFKLTIIEKSILDARIKGQSIGQIGPLFSFLCISGLKNRITYLREALFPNREVIRQEFGSFSGPKRFIFYPYRFFQALIVLSKHFSDVLTYMVRGR